MKLLEDFKRCRITRLDERKEKMTKDELLDYIKNRRYSCCFCADLKKQVLKKGLIAIDQYNGMVCGGVEDMKLRNSDTTKGG